MQDLIILTLFPWIVIFAASSDVFSMTISNRVTLGLVIAFLIVAPFSGMSMHDIGMHVATGAAALVFTFTLFAFGVLGGGDAKLIAAISLWIGWSLSLEYLLVAALMGGALTIGILYLRSYPIAYRLNWKWLMTLSEPEKGVPYGVALSGAALWVYMDSPIVQAMLAT